MVIYLLIYKKCVFLFLKACVKNKCVKNVKYVITFFYRKQIK